MRADFTCADDAGGSGIAPGYCVGTVDAGAAVDTTTLGTHTFSVTATDRSGNAATTTVSYEVVDATAPTVSSPHDGIEYQLGQPVPAQFACTDEDGGSGVASCVGPELLDTSSTGTKTLEVTTTDHAGNNRTRTIAYRVAYAYGEVLEPIDRDGSSVFKAGSTVPVKFALSTYQGGPVGGAVVTLDTVRTYDLGGSGSEAARPATAKGGSNDGNLFRSSPGGRYTYNLSTKGLAPGGYQLLISLDDGKQYSAVFSLR